MSPGEIEAAVLSVAREDRRGVRSVADPITAFVRRHRAHVRYYSLQAARTVCHHPFTLRRLVFPLLILLLSTFPAGSTEPPPLLLTIDGSPSMGKAEAPVVI